jgi:hypothetical protein
MSDVPTDRRALFAAVAAALATSACERKTAATPEVDMELVGNAMGALGEAIDALQMSMGGFGKANWKDVVPQVSAAVTEVRNSYANLQQALGASSDSDADAN